MQFVMDTISSGKEDDGKQDMLLYELKNILDNKSIRTVFQPIVSLTDAAVIGYEALSRGPEGSPLEWPNILFKTANEYELTWELEYLCRCKALVKAQEMHLPGMVFINIDPRVIHDSRFQKGLTKEFLAEHGLDATKVIFEITEKTAIEDYKNFRKVLDIYTSQGYKIAIDDTGAGYSGLSLLAQTSPHYIKIDMELVRNIDKDGLKQAMLKALNDFAVMTNSKIIAEGIETIDELATLIDLGIPYGQGYFLQKPAQGFLDITPDARQFISSRNDQKKRELFHTSLTIPIGEIARHDPCFSPEVLGYKALEYFNANRNVHGIPVVKDGKPVGLLMKNKFLANLATQYGVAVYMNRTIGLLMDHKPLIVEYDTPLEQVSKSAVTREADDIYDYIIIVRGGQYYGMTTVKQLLIQTSQLELNRAKHSNPLTGLPGNMVIEQRLKHCLTENTEFAVLYFDLDNFKAYNDVYGFENGDKILCATAELLQNELRRLAVPGVFLGHIGGDDFIAVVNTLEVTAFCQAIIRSFDERIRDFFTEQDKRQGFIVTKNRHGVVEKYPLTSLSIAVVTNKNRTYKNPEEIGEAAVLLKKHCKMTWESCFEIA
ncbi:MAG: diguanylate cyclase/phosphodiesterase with domain containing protein [Firmicutes bacterium]|nr:diguanylate cyclase/phosphodiesterase with domain containing protein [Bacillota bacterium]